LSLAVIAAVCSLVYLPGLSGGFALDDYTNVVDNAAITIGDLSWRSLSHAMFSFQAGPTMRPLAMLTFALNEYFTGVDPGAFKTTNLVIHLINGALVYWLLSLLLSVYRKVHASALPETRFAGLATLTAALWLLHPLNVMPVLYVVQRETSLSSLFVLLGLCSYVWARRRMLESKSGGWILCTLAPLATLAAVLCKESGALLPVYALAIEAFVFRFRSASGVFSRPIAGFYLVFLLLPGCAGFAWILAHHGYLDYSNRDYGMGERLLTETRILWLYIRWTLMPLPSELGLYHDDFPFSRGLLEPPTTLISVIGLAGLAVSCFLLRRRKPLVALGIAWFLGGQLMESTIFPLELIYEHRCYLPDLGLLFALMSLLYPLKNTAVWRYPRYALLLVALAGCGVATWVRAYNWRDNLSFAQSEAWHHPQSAYATYMLGQTYANLALESDPGQYDNAVASLKKASTAPNSTIIPDVSLVLVEAQLRKRVEPGVMERIAAKVSDRRIAASDIQGLSALGECVGNRNCVVDNQEMLAIFNSALTNPNLDRESGAKANILVIYGNYIAAIQQDLRRARELMLQAATLVPTEPQYQENVVTMDISLKDAEQARRDLDNLRRLNYLGHLDPAISTLESEIDKLPPAGSRR